MNNTTQFVSLRVAALLCLLVAGAPTSRSAEPRVNDHIAYLRLRISGDTVILQQAALARGTLKPEPKRRHPASLRCVLESTNGTAMIAQVIADPRVRRVEYPDPHSPHGINAVEVRQDDAEFTVRVPWKPGFRSAAFYAPASGEKRAARTLAADDQFLGRIELPQP